MSAIRRSAIWNVFTETHKSDFIATCNICSQEFSYRSTTTNLMKHLQRKHPSVTIDLQPISQKPKEGISPKQVEIVIERQLENECEVKSFKVEVQPVPEDNCDFIVLDSGKTTSNIWDYFTKVPSSDSVASCNVCRNEFSYKTTTSNLKKHLERKHPEQLSVSEETNCKLIVYDSHREASSSDETNCDSIAPNRRHDASPVWSFFTKKPRSDFVASCNICQNEFSYKTTINNLKTHLEKGHPEQLPTSGETTNCLAVANDSNEEISGDDENICNSAVSSSRYTSPLCNFFTKVPTSDSTAACNIGQNEFSSETTTTNLKNHLEIKHSELLPPTEGINNSSPMVNDSDEEMCGIDEQINDTDVLSSRHTSRMWKFFTKIPNSDSAALCNICQNEFSYKTSTLNLKLHLEQTHPEQLLSNGEINYKLIIYASDEEESISRDNICNRDVSSSRYTSPLWNFFTKIATSETAACCNICQKEISYKTSITNFKKHLEKMHPEQLLGSEETKCTLTSNDSAEEPSNNDSTVLSSRHTSPVWNFFTRIPSSNFVATCNFCQKELSYKTSTSNLKKHLLKKHPEQLTASDTTHTLIVYDSDEEASSSEENISNSTVLSSRHTSPIWNFFTRIPNSDFVAFCTICQRELSYKTSTSNLKRHLVRVHPEQLPASGETKFTHAADDSDKAASGSDDKNCSSEILSSRHCSPMWNFFTKMPASDSLALCNICLNEFSYKTSISNLKRHLETVHPEQLPASEETQLTTNDSDEVVSNDGDNNLNSLLSSSRHTSPMWNFFTKIPTSDSIALCSICQKQISYKMSITNLKRHLEKKHPEQLLLFPVSKETICVLAVSDSDDEVSSNDEKIGDTAAVSSRCTSPVWNFFTKIPNSNYVASCNFCQTQISYRTTITNLKRHLKIKHPKHLRASDKPVTDGSDEETSSSDEEDCDNVKVNSRKNGSPVWNFFTKKPASDYVATCNLCQKDFSYKSTTANLQRHMNRKHSQLSTRDEADDDFSTSISQENNSAANCGKKLSLKWSFFTKIPNSDYVASCNICNNDISYKSTTANLLKHVKRKHPKELNETNVEQSSDDEEESDSDEKDVVSNARKRESRMWEFFTKIPTSDAVASCNFCQKKISYKSSTGNLQKHVDRKHPKKIASNGDETDFKSEDSTSTDDEEEHCGDEKKSNTVVTNSGKKGSRMWEFFTKSPGTKTKASCNFCHKEISYKSTTNNLQKHMGRKHPKKLGVSREKNSNFIVRNSDEEQSHTNEKYFGKVILDSGTFRIWDCFTKKSASDSVASCNFCQKEFSYKTTTGNLKRHIERKHREHLVESGQRQDQPIFQEQSFTDQQDERQQQQGILLEEVKEFETKIDVSQPVDDGNDIDDDFWNMENSDDDPDFRPSPAFDEGMDMDVKSTTPGKKRSQIWNAFTEKPMSDCVAICNVCNQEFCYRSTTNNLKKHFQRKHPNMTFENKIERNIEITVDAELREVKTEVKRYADDEDRDSSDEAASATKRKRSQIWNYFTRKKPGEYVATCNICKKELGFRSTTSNLKKHLDRKHPQIEIKTEHEVQKKEIPEVPIKTCLICLENDQSEPKEFIQVNSSDPEEKNYMTKIQEIMNQTVVIDESHVICQLCVEDLEKVIQFKEKISKAFEFWSKVEAEPEPEPESYDNCAEDTKYSDYSDLEDGESLAKFTCNKCHKVFPSPSIMLKHNCGQPRKDKPPIKKEIVDKNTKYYCEICGRCFNIKWKLNKHLKKCQSNANKQFICTLCNRIFKKSFHLREHMASHTGERNYSCNLCGKTFQRSSSKHKHMRSHNAKPGEKSKKTPFLCTICGKSFPYSNGASRHMRVHLGERRHQCHICLKRFSQTTHLKVHLRTHSGERPYGCMICGRTFSLNASLRKHMRLHVGSGDLVKLVKSLETNLGPTEIVTEDGLHVLTAVSTEIDMDGNQCLA